MDWTIEQVVAATGATVVAPPDPGGARRPGPPTPSGPVSAGISIDSRTLVPGDLFVAVRAGRDGHDFTAAAVEAGAGAVLVERVTGVVATELVVPDTAAALLDLGRAARARLTVPVTGITGSVGKTSTKDLAAAAAASMRVVSSPRSFNNELGLPLTLANAPEDAEMVVLEMGARGPGHIAMLCQVAEPTIGVVTAVAAAHIEMFGDLDGVAKAKGELVEALPASGFAVLNGDDQRTRAMAGRTSASTLLYSVAEGAAHSRSRSGAGSVGPDVVAEGVTLDDELRPRFRLVSPWGRAEVRLEARGAHQVGNSLAALAAAVLSGVPLDAAVAGLAGGSVSPLRMEVLRTPSGARVINDSYNANPASVAAALRALVALPGDRRVAVLGPMAELGVTGPAEHRSIAALAARLGVEVIAVSTPDYGVQPVPPEEVGARLGDLGPGTAILVKGSRVAALESVAERLIRPT